MSKHTTATRTATRPTPRHRRPAPDRRPALLAAAGALLALLALLAAATLTPATAATSGAPAAAITEADAPPATDTTLDAVSGEPAPAPVSNPEPYWAEPAEDGPTAAPIREEDEGWQCWVHGNKECGAEVIDPSTGHPMPVVITYVDGVADSVRFR